MHVLGPDGVDRQMMKFKKEVTGSETLMSLRDVEKFKSRAVKRLTTKFQREMQQSKRDFHKMGLAENINSQDMETLLLFQTQIHTGREEQRKLKCYGRCFSVALVK